VNQVSKREIIAGRRKKILQILSAAEDGQVEYSALVEKLSREGYEVRERTVRQDCKHLFDRGLAMKGGTQGDGSFVSLPTVLQRAYTEANKNAGRSHADRPAVFFASLP